MVKRDCMAGGQAHCEEVFVSGNRCGWDKPLSIFHRQLMHKALISKKVGRLQRMSTSNASG